MQALIRITVWIKGRVKGIKARRYAALKRVHIQGASFLNVAEMQKTRLSTEEAKNKDDLPY